MNITAVFFRFLARISYPHCHTFVLALVKSYWGFSVSRDRLLDKTCQKVGLWNGCSLR